MTTRLQELAQAAYEAKKAAAQLRYDRDYAEIELARIKKAYQATLDDHIAAGAKDFPTMIDGKNAPMRNAAIASYLKDNPLPFTESPDVAALEFAKAELNYGIGYADSEFAVAKYLAELTAAWESISNSVHDKPFSFEQASDMVRSNIERAASSGVQATVTKQRLPLPVNDNEPF